MARLKAEQINRQERLRIGVFKKPDFLDTLPTRGRRAKEIAHLAEQLKKMETDEVRVFETPEFIERFNLGSKTVLEGTRIVRSSLISSHGLKGVRFHHDEEDGRIYVWKGFSRQ